MTRLTLLEAMKLNGIEDWELNPKEQKFLVDSTNDLVQRHGKEWVVSYQKMLQDQLKIVFNEMF